MIGPQGMYDNQWLGEAVEERRRARRDYTSVKPGCEEASPEEGALLRGIVRLEESR